jgi:hypothetical protein
VCKGKSFTISKHLHLALRRMDVVKFEILDLFSRSPWPFGESYNIDAMCKWVHRMCLEL